MNKGWSVIRRAAAQLVAGLALLAIATPPGVAAPSAAAPDAASQFLVVDCLLPGQVRKLGRRMTYISPRRAVRTSASDCEIRGGEYVSYDRADYRTALAVWMPGAEQGDARSQTYVGEIYQKGLGQAADYNMAAQWYKRAADQNYAPALVNLAFLYQEGLGVARDQAKADVLFQQVARYPPDIAPLVHTAPVALPPKVSPKGSDTPDLRKQIAKRNSEIDRLKAENVRLIVDAAAKAKEAAVLSERLNAERAAIAAERARTENQRAAVQDQERARIEEQRAVREAALAQQARALAVAKAELDSARSSTSQERVATEKRVHSMVQALAAAQKERDVIAAGMATQTKQFAEREKALAAREEALKQSELRLASLQTASAVPAARGPVIELIEPNISPTRGENVIVVASAIRMRTVVGMAWAPTGLRVVTVNGQRQAIDEAGMFQLDVDVSTRETPVEIVAIDRKGLRKAMTFAFQRDPTQRVIAGAPEAPLDARKRIKLGVQHALLIGNSNYAMMPKLNTPKSDVDAIGKLLRERYGFKVTILYDATRYEILSAFNKLRSELTDKDDLLIYYAGHGQMVTMDNRNRGYWLPIDAEPKNTANWISTADITDAVASLNIHKVLLVADSCYSGLLTRSTLEQLDAAASEDARVSYLQTIAQQKSRNVFTSGGTVPVLDVGGGINSLFAKAVLNALRDARSPIQGQDLARIVQQSVSFAASSIDFEQMPQYAPLQMAGHESGDYVFVPLS